MVSAESKEGSNSTSQNINLQAISFSNLCKDDDSFNKSSRDDLQLTGFQSIENHSLIDHRFYQLIEQFTLPITQTVAGP